MSKMTNFIMGITKDDRSLMLESLMAYRSFLEDQTTNAVTQVQDIVGETSNTQDSDDPFGANENLSSDDNSLDSTAESPNSITEPDLFDDGLELDAPADEITDPNAPEGETGLDTTEITEPAALDGNESQTTDKGSTVPEVDENADTDEFTDFIDKE